MPHVEMELEIRAPIDRVWNTVIDIERYPETMENVRSASVVEWKDDNERICAWSVTLKGSILEWREVEHLDRDRHFVEFEQLSGDMEIFRGHWLLDQVHAGLTRVTFRVTFEIGIPLLADMLNPVAQRSLRDNCSEMLHGIEQEAVAG
jgi:ribosome-associated toxin RatA of RatAB toxin-antitoxin module